MTLTYAHTRLDTPPRAALLTLARIEAGRMLRHPAPWAGLLLTAFWAWEVLHEPWSGAAYEGLLAALTPLLLGVSLASVSTFARERVPVADEAPLTRSHRMAARLLSGVSMVALVALVVAAGVVWLRASGGLGLGDEPGRTASAHHSLPELVQPVLLAALAVVVGAGAVALLRQRLAASIALVVGWFLVGATYWLFNVGAGRWLTPLQSQPVLVEVGPVETDPTTFPTDWLLAAPGEFQEHWARIVVSPSLAAWHDVYLVGLIAVLSGLVAGGRCRRVLLVVGTVAAVGAVVAQRAVSP